MTRKLKITLTRRALRNRRRCQTSKRWRKMMRKAELEDETGEVEGNEDLDKDMWGEDEDEKEDKSELEDSEEKGKAEEENMDELAAKEDIEKSEKNDEKRQRKEEEKEKENEPQEFDDNQTDAEHGKDETTEEP